MLTEVEEIVVILDVRLRKEVNYGVMVGIG